MKPSKPTLRTERNGSLASGVGTARVAASSEPQPGGTKEKSQTMSAVAEPSLIPERADLFTTGEMARISGTTLRTVRFYEEAGLLHPIGRTDGGHRLFRQAELDRLMLVTDMREAGMNLDDIRLLLETKLRAHSGAEAAREAQTSIESTIVLLKQKIAAMTRLREDLESTVAATRPCLDCGDQELFPDHCGKCERMGSGDGQTPRALRVLWALGEMKRA